MNIVFVGQNQQSDVRYVISGSTPLVRPEETIKNNKT